VVCRPPGVTGSAPAREYARCAALPPSLRDGGEVVQKPAGDTETGRLPAADVTAMPARQAGETGVAARRAVRGMLCRLCCRRGKSAMRRQQGHWQPQIQAMLYAGTVASHVTSMVR